MGRVVKRKKRRKKKRRVIKGKEKTLSAFFWRRGSGSASYRWKKDA